MGWGRYGRYGYGGETTTMRLRSGTTGIITNVYEQKGREISAARDEVVNSDREIPLKDLNSRAQKLVGEYVGTLIKLKGLRDSLEQLHGVKVPDGLTCGTFESVRRLNYEDEAAAARRVANERYDTLNKLVSKIRIEIVGLSGPALKTALARFQRDVEAV